MAVSDTRFKFEIGEKVLTDFNGMDQEVIIVDRFRWPSETGKGYRLNPNIGTGDGVDENWLRKI